MLNSSDRHSSRRLSEVWHEGPQGRCFSLRTIETVEQIALEGLQGTEETVEAGRGPILSNRPDMN